MGHRHFNSELYTFKNSYSSKLKAEEFATKLRQVGYNVRIIASSKGYDLWVRRM